MPSATSVILKRGYFPRELPPSFTTASFAAIVDAGLPAAFDLLLKKPTKANPAYVSSPAVHNLARAGTLRRKLSIPNPVNQYQLTRQIVGGWKEIAKHCRASTLSLSSPTYQKNDAEARAIGMAQPFSHLPLARAKTRAGFRFLMSTDLNAFYSSIYTHSIPWALHGKAVAKKKRLDYALLGNRLDLALRNAQSGQTIGIPIGPDPSLVIAEILTSAVDCRLPKEMQDGAFRFIDDIECGFMNASDAESALARTQNEFAEFELSLNPRKTRVIQLPHSLEVEWVPHLRLFPMGTHSQRSDVLGFFGRAFELAREQREEAILKYAVQRMRSVEVANDNWRLYEDILLGCLAVESGTTPAVVAELTRYAGIRDLDLKRIANALDRLIQYHAPQHHGSEVVWSVWFMAKMGLPLSKLAVQRAIDIPDPTVRLCCLYARDLGLVEAGVDWSAIEQIMRTEELSGSQWLLAYEAKIKGWLPSYKSTDHLAASPHFDHLRGCGVFFFEPGAELKVEKVKRKRVAGDLNVVDVDVDEEDDAAAYAVSG